MCPGLSGGEAGSSTCWELSLACVSVCVCCVLWMAGWVFADGWELASVGDPRGSMLGLIFFLLFFSGLIW